MNAIEVEGVTKAYRLYHSPRDWVKERLSPSGKKYHREFYALDDVSFGVGEGEMVGIVGRNGSGKSTLLKIICGVIRPTCGSVRVQGRISSILELGAGFNPEFTGRDNVYMNGALMGFNREEMDRRIPEIEAFAEIDQFIDHPVKLYSSGMYVRLAFATAVNVDPDILVVDEALSVGDEAFQRKCFSKIHQIQSRGSTILFVSHNPSVILEFCNRAILLDHGKMTMNGTPKTVVSNYKRDIHNLSKKVSLLRKVTPEVGLNLNDSRADEPTDAIDDMNMATGLERDPLDCFDPNLKSRSAVFYESTGALIEAPRITTREGDTVNILSRGREYWYTYDVLFTENACSARFGMSIKTTRGVELGGLLTHSSENPFDVVEKGTVLRIRFPFRCCLLPGVYFLNAGVLGMVNGTETYLHRCIDIAAFRVKPERYLRLKGMIDFSTDSLGGGVDISMVKSGDYPSQGVNQGK